ncbi:hypothetical protein ASD50_08335 [Mesorhizobium sp. Root552]|nr:hypothetical protein ASD50_08335 [Mesorhizobium sp. Root552]
MRSQPSPDIPTPEKNRTERRQEVEALRLKLLENGFSPIRNRDKATFMKDWPFMEITPEVVRSWSRIGRDRATGLRLDNGLAAIDIDIDDHALVAALANAVLDMVPELDRENVPLLVRTSGKAKEAWFVRTEEPFGRIYTRRWVKAGETLDEGSHVLEIFGGASARQMGAFGPHTVERDGTVMREYSWRDQSPADVRLEELPVLTKSQFFAIADKAEELMRAAGWEPVALTEKGENAAQRVYDLTDDLLFDVHEGPHGVSMAELKTMAEADGDGLRVSASWLEGPDPKRSPDRCLVSITRSGHLAVWDSATGVTHVEVAGEPVDPGVLTMPASAPGELILTTKGWPRWCHENACILLEHDPEWIDALAYDEFNCKTLLLRPIPGATMEHVDFRPRELRDTDVINALRWFNRRQFPSATRAVLYDAMLAVARQSIISPVRHYLEDLHWDGSRRLDTWLVDYCGAEDTAYTRAVGRRWMLSAVARALKPGCKADYCMILEGEQGIGKSTLLRRLASSEWFHDGLRDMTSKDASMALRGRWIVELPELSAMRRSDVEAVKAFLSRNEERYRPPYDRAEVSEPRRCVFAGTTNRTDYLLDDTGARRFWPVRVTRADTDSVANDRDQLWAEAVVAYRAEEPWWPSDDMAREAAQVAATRTEDDPWTGPILNYVEKRDEVGSQELLAAVSLPQTVMTKADAKRATGILRRNGWTRDGQFTKGPNKGAARYVRVPAAARRAR